MPNNLKDSKNAIKRQRTIVGILLKEIGHQLATVNEQAQLKLKELIGLVTQLKNQKRKDKKIYSLHAPYVECIEKGKSAKPYEFYLKTSIVVSHQTSLIYLTMENAHWRMFYFLPFPLIMVIALCGFI